MLPAAQRSLKMKEIISHVAVIEQEKLRGKDIARHTPRPLTFEDLQFINQNKNNETLKH